MTDLNMPKNSKNVWTLEEDERLKQLLEASAPIHLIAASLKRSVPAVKGRAHILGLSIKRVAVKRTLPADTRW